MSVITEIELLSWPHITAREIKLLENMLSMFTVVELNRYVKAEAIKIRRKHKLKLPDVLVAASAISCDVPLFTFDKGFRKVTELNLVLLDY